MLKNIVIQHKGITSLLFVFIFLYSSFFRAFPASNERFVQPVQKIKFDHEKSSFSSLENKIVGLTIADQFKKEESESEEIDFGFSFEFDYQSFISPSHLVRDFYQSKDLSYHKIPLYDMFCKWKFHLS